MGKSSTVACQNYGLIMYPRTSQKSLHKVAYLRYWSVSRSRVYRPLARPNRVLKGMEAVSCNPAFGLPSLLSPLVMYKPFKISPLKV